MIWPLTIVAERAAAAHTLREGCELGSLCHCAMRQAYLRGDKPVSWRYRLEDQRSQERQARIDLLEQQRRPRFLLP